MARKRLNDLGEKYIPRLLRSSDPYKEARDTWYANKAIIRDIYQFGCPDLALKLTQQLSGDLQDRSLPPEVNHLRRTIAR